MVVDVIGGEHGHAQGDAGFLSRLDDTGHGGAAVDVGSQTARGEFAQGAGGLLTVKGTAPALVDPLAPVGQHLQHGAVFQGGGTAFGGQILRAQLIDPGSVVVAEVLQQLKAIAGGNAVGVILSGLGAEFFQLLNGDLLGDHDAQLVRDVLVVVQHGGGADVGEGMQLAVLVAGDVQHPAHQVGAQLVSAFHAGDVRQGVLVQRVGDIGVAQGHNVGSNAAGGSGESSPDFGIARLSLVGDMDAQFLADGLVEGLHLMIDHGGLRAGSAGGPEQDLDGLVGHRHAAQGQRQDSDQQDAKQLFHVKRPPFYITPEPWPRNVSMNKTPEINSLDSDFLFVLIIIASCYFLVNLLFVHFDRFFSVLSGWIGGKRRRMVVCFDHALSKSAFPAFLRFYCHSLWVYAILSSNGG